MANQLSAGLSAITIEGDGISTTVSFDILKSPTNAPWGSKHPTSILSATINPFVSGLSIASFSLTSTTVTLNFNQSFTGNIGIDLVFLF